MAKRKNKVDAMEEQGQLPGVESEKNPKVHSKALRYARARDERMALTKDEDEAKTDLIETMKEAGLTRYVYRDVTVDLTNTSGIKVKIEKPGGGNEEGEE
jgi:hypothetical protein